MNELRPEIERRCLSCLFKDSSTIIEAITNGLKPEHFSGIDARSIYLALIAAASATPEIPPIESIMAGAFAGSSGFSPASIIEIEQLEVTSYKARQLVANVIALAKSSKAMALLTEAMADAKSADATDWAATWEAIGPKLTAISALTADRKTATFAQLVDSYVAQQRNPETVRTIATGLPRWDFRATEVRVHEMIVLAGRPGAGKTALAVQMARFVARTQTVAVFSLEMSGIELVSRLALSESGKPGPSMSDTADRIKAINSIRDIPTIKVYEDPYVTVEQIEARCQLLAADKGLGLVVIDYLQLIEVSADMKKAPREQQVAQMSRRLKLMPKRIGCPVLILAQLNRESEKENRPPRKSDLRESGSIEQDADRIWLLYNHIPEEDEVEDPNLIVLVQDKCRAGPAYEAARLIFNRPCFHFTERQ